MVKTWKLKTMPVNLPQDYLTVSFVDIVFYEFPPFGQ